MTTKRNAVPAELPVDDPNVGEIWKDDEPTPGIVERIKTAVVNAVSTTRPMLDSLGRIVDADPSKFNHIERQQYAGLEPGSGGVRLLRHMWREAMDRRGNAVNALRHADERIASLKRLAAADGLAREFALLGTPKPADPERPPMQRVRALAPWTRLHHREVSPELAAWLRVNENVEELSQRYPPQRFSSAGLGHVRMVPVDMAADLVREKLAELVGDDVPLQLPNGQRIG